MTGEQVKQAAIGIIGGLAYFLMVLSACIYLSVLNTQYAPNFPWYPIPVLIITIGSIFLVNQRWDIGLTLPPDRPWGKIYGFALAITLAGFALSALQGSYNGMVRGTEGGPGTTSPALEIADAFTVAIAVAAIAEIGYRGIMFPWVQKAFGLWPAVLIVGFINTVAHRWEDYSPRWIGLFVLLAGWSYLRHISGSVVPPLVTHVVMNFVIAIGFWFWGPWDQGAMSASWLTVFAVLAVASLGASVYLARSVNEPPTLSAPLASRRT